MQKTYSETFLIRTSQCDLTGAWRPSDIMAVMQELAGTHAHLLGCGRDALIRQNIVWVLSRAELVMDRYPTVGETVRVETFPTQNRRWFFPRYYCVYDEAGHMIGKAGSLWLLMDFQERKMAPPEAILHLMPDNSDLTPPLPMPGNIPMLGGAPALSTRMPTYTNIDVNKHVNNTRYADWLCDTLGIDIMAQNEIAHLLIHFTHEIMPGQEMALSLLTEGNAFRLTGQHGEDKHFDIGGSLRERKNPSAAS